MAGLMVVVRCRLVARRCVVPLQNERKLVVGLHKDVAPTDIDEGMHVALHPKDYCIVLALPPKIDPR